MDTFKMTWLFCKISKQWNQIMSAIWHNVEFVSCKFISFVSCRKLWFKEANLLRVRRRGMLHPHYVRAWDSVAWCGEARMTFRNAIVVFLFSFQMHRALSDWWSFLAECDIHGYQGREKGEGVHKKPWIKGCSLCSVSPVLGWNGRNVAGRLTGSQSPQPLMNFKRPFSFKAGCWLTACRLAKHSKQKKKEKRRREEHKWVRKREKRRCWQG